MIGKRPPFLLILLCGLLTTEIVASLHIYLSNLQLYKSLTAIQAAGYLPVPGPLIMARLQDLRPALAGGLFFALTLGAGLTLTTLAAIWVWVRLFSRARSGLAIIFLGWGAMLVAVNSNGFNPLPFCYFLAVPAAVGFLSLKWAKGPLPLFNLRKSAVSLLPLLLLALVWWSQLDSDMFLRIRDHLLLANPVGRTINDFYYRYTLYAAEVFKPLHQKTLKTCFIEDLSDKPLKIRAESTLRSRDFLSIESRSQADMIVAWQGDSMLFEGPRVPRLKILRKAFFADPDRELARVSLFWDKNSFLRTAVFFSLLLGFPVALYCLLLSLVTWMLALFVKPGTAQAGAAMVCLLMGCALYLPVWQARVPTSQLSDLNGALLSEKWQIRLSALRRIADRQMEIGDIANYHHLLDSPSIAERYWLARALGSSHKDDTYPELLRLLDDPHPNVVCQAYYGLGQRGQKKAIPRILEKMQASEHWYSQWYGYRALKALGWIQPLM